MKSNFDKQSRMKTATKAKKGGKLSRDGKIYENNLLETDSTDQKQNSKKVLK